MEDRIALIERTPLFAGLDRDAHERIAELTEEVEVAAGTVLTHEGRHEGYFYVVVAGTVEISRGGTVVDTAGAGDFIGEISLIDDGPRTATATAVTPTLLLQATNRAFDELMEADPAIRDGLQEAMNARLGRMDDETA